MRFVLLSVLIADGLFIIELFGLWPCYFCKIRVFQSVLREVLLDGVARRVAVSLVGILAVIYLIQFLHAYIVIRGLALALFAVVSIPIRIGAL